MNNQRKWVRIWRCEQCTHKWRTKTIKRQEQCPVCKSTEIGFFKKKEEK